MPELLSPKSSSGIKHSPVPTGLAKIVSLACVLAIFLMIITSCKRPRSMDLSIGKSTVKNDLPVPYQRTMVICMGKDNKVVYYLGNPDKPLVGPALTGYGKDSLHKVVITIMDKIKAKGDTLIVLIKGSDKSTYKNFVNVLDEMKFSKVFSYGVVDISPREIDLLKKHNAY